MGRSRDEAIKWLQECFRVASKANFEKAIDCLGEVVAEEVLQTAVDALSEQIRDEIRAEMRAELRTALQMAAQGLEE